MRVLPRRFRPHSIIIKQEMPEDSNGVAVEKSIVIQHVKADQDYGIQQSKRGITTDDRLIAYIELGDYIAHDEYGFSVKYIKDFKIKPNDTLSFRNENYVITSVNEIILESEQPVRLEITAK